MSIQRKGIVIVICAPSGAGKTTLIKKLREEFPNFGYSVSHTTREPREGEVNGVDYNFISVQDFKEKRDSGFFAEWAKVHGSYYGTNLDPILAILEQGQDVLFDIDVQGASQLRLSLPSAIFTFILPPSMQELRTRLKKRGTDNTQSIDQRLSNASYEIAQANWFDYWVVNDDIDQAYDQLRATYVAATLEPKHYLNLTETLLSDTEE